jgi:L-asparagine transporter-like permease
MMAISMFGALFTWMMIFVTHYFFRRRWVREGGAKLSFRMPGFPVLTLLGAGAMLAILVTTYFTSVFKLTLVFGVPFLVLLAAAYYLLFKKRGEAVAMSARRQRA